VGNQTCLLAVAEWEDLKPGWMVMGDETNPPPIADGWRLPPQLLPLVMVTSQLGRPLLGRLLGLNADALPHGMAIHLVCA
jgi:hypothetical protein